MPSEREILEALRQVEDPDLHRDIVSLGFVQDVQASDGRVSLRIVLTTPACPVREQMKEQAEEILLSMPDVKEVNVTMDAEVRGSRPAGQAQPVEGVSNIIAVASNKGGAGKSTVAVNLAIALAKRGARVGLLDADVTGPNVPIMMGFEAGFMAESGSSLRTVEKYGVRLISLGFVLSRLSPVVWRGPMVGTAIRQLLHDVKWGETEGGYEIRDFNCMFHRLVDGEQEVCEWHQSFLRRMLQSEVRGSPCPEGSTHCCRFVVEAAPAVGTEGAGGAAR